MNPKARLTPFFSFAWYYLLVFLSFPSMAQIETVSGYIVTAKRDTVMGLIENRSKSSDYKSCYFKKNEKDKITSYAPGEIAAFGLDNLKDYESITIKYATGKEVAVFARVILSGRANLLRYQNGLYLRHDSLGTRDLRFEGLQDLKGMNKIRGQLNFLFSDCKTKRIAWDSIILSNEKIYELVNNYNLCKNSSLRKKVILKAPSVKGTFGVFAGQNTQIMQIASITYATDRSTLGATRFDNSVSPIFGLSYCLTFPRFSSNSSVYTEISYFASDVKGFGSIQGTYYKETEDLALSANYLRLAIGTRLLFPARHYTPFIKFGISRYNASNFSGTRTQRQKTITAWSRHLKQIPGGLLTRTESGLPEACKKGLPRGWR